MILQYLSFGIYHPVIRHLSHPILQHWWPYFK